MLTLWKQLPGSPVGFSGSSLLAAVSICTPGDRCGNENQTELGRHEAKGTVQTILPVPSTEEVVRLQRVWGRRASRMRHNLSRSFVFGDKRRDTDENTLLEKLLWR